MKESILSVLKNEGYITNYIVKKDDKKMIEVYLKYYNGYPVIQKITRISRPGLRVYRKFSLLPKVMNGFGISVISTSYGVMSNLEAEKKRLGGEILCFVE